MQKVVRTYNGKYLNPMGELRELLDDGYVVVMCHEIAVEKEKCLEYIVERKTKHYE